jgi:hypothetical protein
VEPLTRWTHEAPAEPGSSPRRGPHRLNLDKGAGVRRKVHERLRLRAGNDQGFYWLDWLSWLNDLNSVDWFDLVELERRVPGVRSEEPESRRPIPDPQPLITAS